MKDELLTIAKKHNYTVKVRSALRDERTTPKTFSIFQSGHSKPCLRKHMSWGRKAKIPIAQNNYYSPACSSKFSTCSITLLNTSGLYCGG